jgi:pSer/pThr/pTyr-binding forkhead associated (FHA) protein
MVAPAGFGATQQMPAAGLGDTMRTQMGGTTTCPVCKSTTPLMEIYCGDCGYLLSSVPLPDLEAPTEEAPIAELVDLTDGRRHRLNAGVNTVGRQGTDVLVNDGTVSRVHARITIDPNGDGILIEDMGSSNGTKVGDKRIGANQPTPAMPGMELKFGNWRVMIERGSDAHAPATIMGDATIAIPTGAAIDRTIVGMPTLDAAGQESATSHQIPATAVALLEKTQGPGADITLNVGHVTLGRRPDNTVVLTGDSYISGRHAEIVTDSSETYLTDLGSTNGTLVNGQKLTPQERQLLLEGDEVQLGQTRYIFKPLPQAEGAPAVEDSAHADTPTDTAEDVSIPAGP